MILRLSTLVDGFSRVKEALAEEPVAISFAFPGPADYLHGVIGDLPNFPAFRGGVAGAARYILPGMLREMRRSSKARRFVCRCLFPKSGRITIPISASA